MSVDAEPILAAVGLDWKFCLRDHPNHSLVRFLAGVARDKGLAVVPKPLVDNPAHTQVMGNKTQGISNHLRDNAEWVYQAS